MLENSPHCKQTIELYLRNKTKGVTPLDVSFDDVAEAMGGRLLLNTLDLYAGTNLLSRFHPQS